MKTLALLVGAMTAGCAEPPRHARLDLPRAEIAEVRGLDEKPSSFSGIGRQIQFQGVDNQSFEGRFGTRLPQTIDLLPGRHVLQCWYQVQGGGPEESGTCDVEMVAKAGHVYLVHTFWGVKGMRSGTLSLEVDDISHITCMGIPKVDLPRNEVAVIQGLECPLALSDEDHLEIEAVDGEGVSDYLPWMPPAIAVAPGKHTLRCSYSFASHGHSGHSGTAEVEIAVQSGCLYQGELAMNADGTPCIAFEEKRRRWWEPD